MAANWTTNQVLAQLDSGRQWTGATITYAFPTSAAGIYSQGESASFRPVGGALQGLFVQAMQTWDDLISPNFQLTSSTLSNLEFGYTTSNIGFAHAYYPTIGSAWFNASESTLASPTIGSYGFQTLVHEIGHALGLNHMGNYDGAGAHTPSSFQDSVVLSIMSYFGPAGAAPLRSAGVMDADWVAQNGRVYSPQSPMVNDILAIQSIYGASTTTRPGDTVYGFSSNITGPAGNIYNFAINPYPILTLFDSGGFDTLNISGWSSSSYIYLESGAYSSCNDMTNNIAIAYGSVIENAIGGGGIDTLYGNDVANRLDGGAGEDVLSGNGGNDTLIGGMGNDTINGGGDEDTAVFSGSFSSYTISYSASSATFSISAAATGTDSVSGVEFFQFDDLLRSSSQVVSSDIAAPTLTSFSPTDNATAVSPTANLVLGFSETVQAGSGSFVIRNANGTIARTIAVTDASQVTIAGNTVTINPSADLASGSSYYVNIAAGVLKDLAGNGFAGISGATTYNFTTAAAGLGDDFPWSTNTSGVVVVNGAASRGTINFVGDTDLFKVNLTAGATYVFDLAHAIGGLADPFLELYDSAMSRLTSDNDSGGSGNARITYTAGTSGTYYLGAYNAFASGSGTGAYTLAAAINDKTAPTLTSFSPVDNATGVSPTANLILGFSETVQAGSGSFIIRNANGTVARTIAVTDTAQVTIAGSTVTINPSADLASGSSYYVNIAAGVLKDLAGNNFAGITGTTTYNFTTAAASTGDDFPWNTSTSGVVVVNGVASHGTINSVGDLDLFKVTLAAGTTYVFDLTRATGGLSDPYLVLYGSDVSLIASDNDGGGAGNSRITYKASTSGSFYLGAYDAANGTGAYAISATTLGDDFPWNTNTSGVVTVNGAAARGVIEIASDLDLFKVTMTAGVTYAFNLTRATGGLADPYLVLYSPGVVFIASDDDGGGSGNSRLTYTASASGTYYLGAYDAGSGSGAYTLAAATLGDDFPWNTNTSGVVTVNGAATGGVIEAAGDLDLFKVTLAAGASYVFNLVGTTGGLSDPYLQLWSSNVELIASDDNGGGSGNSRIAFTATKSGTYYLGAYDARGSGTGAYSLSAATVGDDYPWSTDTAGVVSVNGTATGGVIETPDDLDLFRVALTAGTTYVFRLDRAANGLTDPYLQLWSPAIELVAFDDDGGGNKNSLVTYTATRSGTYYLGALDYDNGTGAYAVSAATIDAGAPTLTSFSPADNATAVAPTANLILGFSEMVQAGSGNFLILNANGSVARSIAVTDSSQVTIAGSTVTINPNADLAYGSSYYVNITAGVLKDLAGNNFAGIAGATTYNFTTVAAVYADDFPWATSTNGVVNVNGTGARGMIEAVDDADLFKVTLVASASYVFNLARTTTDGLSDPYLQLWDSSVELVAFDDNSGAAGNARITYKATAGGTYYLGAWDYGPGTGAYTLSAANIGTNGNDMLTGTVDGDSLFGFAGHDTLDGGGGADSMGGGTGNDTYVVDDAGDIVAEKPGEGIDSVRSSISVTLSADVENLILTGSGDIDGSGNGLANSIAGNPVNNILDGRGGADILIGDAGNDSLDGGESDGKADLLNGGAGNDTYKVGAGDTVVEKTVAGADAGGTDSVQTALASYVLGIYLENLTYTGALAFTGTGNALANSLTGGSGNDKLYGMVGDDTLTGGNGNDSLSGGDILGNVGSDTVILSGNLADYLFSRVTGDSITLNRVVTVTHKTSGEKDTLTGIEKVVFADTPAGRLLNGLPKSDTQTDDGLLLNSASPFNDTYVDDETKTTDNDFDGGAGDDSITGGTSVNTLAGGLGKDTLIGGAGNDTLNGGDGNDSLDGGTGDDSLTGGKGDDVYVVDADGDVVSESLAQGSDTVRTTLAGYNLTDKAANVEKLIYDGTANFTGSGNALANTITGNIGNDILDGGENDGKADLLNGGAGDDTYKVGAGDTVIEKTAAGVDAGGTDSVQTALASYVLGLYLENLAHPGTLNFTGTGNALNNSLTGGSGNDKLYGMLGDDALIGGEGNDSLNGGAGNDTLNGGAGNDTLFGGIGDADVAMFSGTADQYRVSRSGLGYAVSGVDGADYLDGIELLRFGDGAPTAIASFLASPQRQLLDLPGHMLSAMIYPATDAARWNAGSPLGAAVTLTYSFMQSIPSYSFAGEHPGFLPMTAVQRSAVVSVLDYYSKVANLTFVEVTDRGGGGQLRFGTDRQTGSTAYAFAPNLTDPAGGDIWLANNQSSNSTFEAGGYGLSTLLHEVGHALGLKHPGNYGSGDVAPFLPADEDTTRHTVMSYNERADGKVVEITGTQASYTHTILDWSAETAMPYDVAAIQYLYGANVAATNNRYTFPTDRAFFATLWDGGGVDVIDCSTFSRTCLIDLNDGAYSSIGKYASPYDMLPPWYAGASVPTYTGQDNLAIAYGATIENAIGGSAGDVLIGSEIANTLAGGAGNDTLTGGAGADVFHFDVAPNAADNIDVLTDFAAGIDKILLDADAFAGLGPTLGGAFHAGGDVLAAIEADDRILYDTTTGFLYYDADGSGATAAIKFALIGAGAHPTLAAADFMLG